VLIETHGAHGWPFCSEYVVIVPRIEWRIEEVLYYVLSINIICTA
jgi:hypothetical protein